MKTAEDVLRNLREQQLDALYMKKEALIKFRDRAVDKIYQIDKKIGKLRRDYEN